METEAFMLTSSVSTAARAWAINSFEKRAGSTFSSAQLINAEMAEITRNAAKQSNGGLVFHES